MADEYDYIVVGMGYAGAIMTARLAQRAKGKKILTIEYGGPVHASNGGATMDHVTMEMTADMFQNAGLPNAGNANAEPLTMVDVPGNYNNVAFREKYGNGRFDMKEFPSCWQGVGLGGNGLYNGALYQEPADWWWNDDVHDDIFVTDKQKELGHNNTYDIMKGYFEKVRKALDGGIQSHPSEDGIHYNHGLYDIIRPHLKNANFDEVDIDTLDLTVASNRFFTVPAVNVKHGIRTGARAWLDMVIDPDGSVKEEFPNLSLLTFTKVEQVCLDSNNTVTGVRVIPSGARKGGLKNHKVPDFNETIIKVKEGGKVIMCCNALPTARVLYKSGIGCKTLNSSVMRGSPDHFTIDNPAVGTVVSEHVSTSLGMKYTGPERPQPHAVHYDPGDFVGNIDFLRQYARYKSGPYAQYGPVVASHFVADLSQIEGLGSLYPEKEFVSPLTTGKNPANDTQNVTTELFYNPYGLGFPAPPVSNLALNPYNGPGTFTIACMLLSPEMRGLFRLKDDNNTAEYVEVYMHDTPQPWDPTEAQRQELHLPDYRKQAEHDTGVMTASIKEVLSLTANDPHIKVTLGPGDGQTLGYKVDVKDKSGNTVQVPIGELDPTNEDHVRAYVQYYDNQEWEEFTVNGQYLSITRWQENHYNSSVPLARNLDVFGEPLEERKSKYGVNPDNCEVRGTKGLCVADSSLFPKVIYCHPIGAVMALAEWAADQICPEEC